MNKREKIRQNLSNLSLTLIGVTKLLLPAPDVSRVEGLLYLIAAAGSLVAVAAVIRI